MDRNAAARASAYRPCRALQPYVKQFLLVESSQARRDAHLPTPGAVAAFSLRGECLLNGGRHAPASALTGLWDRLRTHEHSRDHAVLLVLFTAVGAAAFVREPLQAFTNATEDARGVLAPEPAVERVHEQLAIASDHASRFRLMEDFLLARLTIATAASDPLVAAAVDWIERASNRARITDLAGHIGLSQSALERRFRRRVGVLPGRFASLVRLQHVERLYAEGLNFTSIAHTAGYCDQSHFNKDFKRVTGIAPEEFFRNHTLE